MPPRFFVDAPLAVGEEIGLPADVAHHAGRVLRLRAGTAIVLFDGTGGEFRAELTADSAARARIVAFDPVERESPLRLTLIQSLVAVDKLDWIVEKAVELGVSRILIAPAQRSVVRLDEARSARRLERWRQIVRAACAQCGRNRLPAVDYSASLERALAAAEHAATRLLLHPGAAVPLARALTQQDAVLAVGPEGGFTDEEAGLATRCGFAPVRLGPRILRTETAGLVALAALQACRGDLAGSA